MVLNTIDQQATRRLWGLFADLLDYPQANLNEAAIACQRMASDVDPAAAAPLALFRAWLEQTPPGRVEEVYTAIFDLDVSRSPYAGYHLFGETYQRSIFLIGLKEWFATADFSAGQELPDHLAVLLRFLERCDDGDRRNELIQDALLPALAKILAAGEGKGKVEEEEARQTDGNAASPYLQVLKSLQVVLEQQPRPAVLAPLEEGGVRV